MAEYINKLHRIAMYWEPSFLHFLMLLLSWSPFLIDSYQCLLLHDVCLNTAPCVWCLWSVADLNMVLSNATCNVLYHHSFQSIHEFCPVFMETFNKLPMSILLSALPLWEGWLKPKDLPGSHGHFEVMPFNVRNSTGQVTHYDALDFRWIVLGLSGEPFTLNQPCGIPWACLWDR